jgi:ABC-type transporter Mla subunit MlaD
VVRDLNDQQAAVSQLIRSGDRVLAAVQAADPDLRTLLEGAGTTFDAIADEASSTQAALAGAPKTFTNVRDTLKRADSTLGNVETLAGRIAPGITELRRTASPLNTTLGTVRQVAPDATTTLATLRGALPSINPLLAKVRTLSPALESIGKQAVPSLKCIRPFTPDIMAFFTDWGDYFSNPDGKDKLIRAQVQNYGPAFSNASPFNSAEAAAAFPGLKFGFPRPPGYNAGQPWFLPKCGAGPDALDPTKDPETR